MNRRKLMQTLAGGLALLVMGFSGLTGCSKKEGTESASGTGPQEISLSGAGATFPFPLYSKWMSEYNKIHPNIRINYQSIGSGGGIRQITSGTVDFGATDTPMTESDESKAPRKLHHIPTTIGAVVVAYNIPGVTAALRLDGALLADIFLGKVTKWNDARITSLNEGVALPDLNISVVNRSDGSGTTAVFTDYLAQVSTEWKERVGAGKAVKWPSGLGAKGNEGVTGQVKTTPGAVGYIEAAYASQNQMTTAALKNRAGEFVVATPESATAAAKGREMPDTLHVSLADAEGEGVYPIASYTYLLVYQDALDRVKGEALAQFLWWAIHDGQKYAAELDYAPLPESVVQKLEARLRGLEHQGKLLLSHP